MLSVCMWAQAEKVSWCPVPTLVLLKQSSSKNAPVGAVNLKRALNDSVFSSGFITGEWGIRIPLDEDDSSFQRGAVVSYCYILSAGCLLLGVAVVYLEDKSPSSLCFGSSLRVPPVGVERKNVLQRKKQNLNSDLEIKYYSYYTWQEC